MDLDMELRMQLLEDRYASENRLIQDVARGLTRQAEAALAESSLKDIEPRLPNSLRNFQNYCIILNTLLRKAAE